MSGPGLIEAEPKGLCQLCLARAETRPYGPKGEEICFACGQKDVEATERQMSKFLFGQHSDMVRDDLIRGPSCQGGHSEEGAAIARRLGITFPLRMSALEMRALNGGYDPDELWPWYAKMRKPKR